MLPAFGLSVLEVFQKEKTNWRMTLSVFRRFFNLLFTKGPMTTTRLGAAFLARVFRTKPTSLTQLRVDLGARLENQLGCRLVQYGPFKGMRLSQGSTWTRAELPSMLLGMYEKEVVQALVNLSRRKGGTFVNVGAGDGYFAIGALFSGLFSRTVCFEMSPRSRDVIVDTAELNEVGASLDVFGLADKSFLDKIEAVKEFVFENSVFLFDIEGSEIELIDSWTLERMAEATLVIETHSTFVAKEEQDRLEVLCHKFHNVSEIKTEERNPGAYPELVQWSDDERWAVCSEGRPERGRWLVLSPKHELLADRRS